MDELIERAEALGLRVNIRDLGRRHGELHSTGLVFLNPHKAIVRQRTTLAHEMGHWWHGHDWTSDHDRVADERQVDQYAALLLISANAYAAAGALCDAHAGAIARDLGVSRRLVELRREDFTRDALILATVEAWRVEA